MNYHRILYKGFPSQSVNGLNYVNMSKRQFASSCVYVGHLLQEQPSQVEQFLQGANKARIQLFKKLARIYNLRNAELPKSKWENKDDLFQIFDVVKKITPAHFDILKRTQDGFVSLKKIFSLAQDNKSLNFVSKLQSDILDAGPNQSNIIIGILNSKHKSVFMQKIEQFKSYFKLNENKPKVLSELELDIDKNCFNGKKYDSELAVKRFMQFKTVRDYTSSVESSLIEHYNRYRGRFLWKFTNLLKNSRVEPKDVNKKVIIDLYKSSNADNIEFRLAVMDKFGKFSEENCNKDLSELNKLFKNVEQNKDAKEFVSNFIKRGLAVSSIEELNTVIKDTKLHKANYFFDNVKRIVALSEGKERKNALVNELENPFFIPAQKRETSYAEKYGSMNEYGFIGRINAYLKNHIKSFIYNNIKSKEAVSVITTKTSEPKLKVIAPSKAQKIQLTNEVNDIIKSKLGKRTYIEQEDTYRLKATKIRLSMLPEIFDSIKATRAQNRSQGVEPNVSNRDASRLYELINGANRKTIRYMLKVCDDKGNRIFDVKQITELIERINVFIRDEKASKPSYRAADTKAYYENMYNDLVSSYGKLKRTSKKN